MLIADLISWALVMALPGPDIVAIAHSSVRHGRSAGFLTATGVTLGVAVWSLLSLMGIAAVLNSIPSLRNSLPIIGAIVLVGLGLLNLKPIFYKPNDVDKKANNLTSIMRTSSAFKYGLITNISNPKALIFFSAFFTPMMANYSETKARYFVFATLILTSFLVFNAIAMFFSIMRFKEVFDKQFWDIIPGVLFILIGGYYLFSQI